MLRTEFPEPDFQIAMGRRVVLERLDWSRHLDGLFACLGGAGNADIWAWLGNSGPYGDDEKIRFRTEFTASQNSEPRPFQTAVILSKDASEGASRTILGMASLMRIRPSAGSIEIGFIAMGHALQRTALSTEAMYLMMRYVFEDLGYRRYEWKCNDLNEPSKRAAERLGFTYEGTFRQDQIAKGKNRDTAWFSIIDREWPNLKASFEAWLSPTNLDENGHQIQSLQALRTS